MSAGLRCNLKNPKKDAWGRFYDDQPDPFNKDHSPRCVGVHPAIWHLGLVNLIGKQDNTYGTDVITLCNNEGESCDVTNSATYIVFKNNKLMQTSSLAALEQTTIENANYAVSCELDNE